MEAKPDSANKAAFSEKLDAFKAAITLLYIRNNISGRNKFREKWPDVAVILFGEELIGFDTHGTDDYEKRSALEEEAEQRRYDLKKILDTFEESSVKSGVLEMAFIGQIIDSVHPVFVPYMYAPTVIRRVRPSLMPKLPEETQQVQEEKIRQEEKQILSNQPAETLETVAPIQIQPPSTPEVVIPVAPTVTLQSPPIRLPAKGELKSLFNLIVLSRAA